MQQWGNAAAGRLSSEEAWAWQDAGRPHCKHDMGPSTVAQEQRRALTVHKVLAAHRELEAHTVLAAHRDMTKRARTGGRGFLLMDGAGMPGCILDAGIGLRVCMDTGGKQQAIRHARTPSARPSAMRTIIQPCGLEHAGRLDRQSRPQRCWQRQWQWRWLCGWARGKRAQHALSWGFTMRFQSFSSEERGPIAAMRVGSGGMGCSCIHHARRGGRGGGGKKEKERGVSVRPWVWVEEAGRDLSPAPRVGRRPPSYRRGAGARRPLLAALWAAAHPPRLPAAGAPGSLCT